MCKSDTEDCQHYGPLVSTFPDIQLVMLNFPSASGKVLLQTHSNRHSVFGFGWISGLDGVRMVKLWIVC